MFRAFGKKSARILLALTLALFSQMPLVHAHDGHFDHSAGSASVSCYASVSVPTPEPVSAGEHCLRTVSEAGLSGFVVPSVPNAPDIAIFQYGATSRGVSSVMEIRPRPLSPPPNRKIAFALENRRRI